MRYCNKCGNEIKDEDKFCSNCGSPVNNDTGKNNQNFVNLKNNDSNRREMSQKSKITAGLLNILLPFGIGRMYAGYINMGIAQLLVSILTCGFGSIWSFIDGIVIICTEDFRDSNGKIMK